MQYCFLSSEVQYGQSASVDDILESCWRNKVVLKGIIASPLHSEEGILQTLNMKIRYKSNFTVDLHLFVEILEQPHPVSLVSLFVEMKK